jgi:hypothetical protein
MLWPDRNNFKAALGGNNGSNSHFLSISHVLGTSHAFYTRVLGLQLGRKEDWNMLTTELKSLPFCFWVHLIVRFLTCTKHLPDLLRPRIGSLFITCFWTWVTAIIDSLFMTYFTPPWAEDSGLLPFSHDEIAPARTLSTDLLFGPFWEDSPVFQPCCPKRVLEHTT